MKYLVNWYKKYAIIICNTRSSPPEIIGNCQQNGPFRTNEKVSAYTVIRGVFDYNRIPLAPAGCKTIVHDRPDNRASWDNHGSCGFYIGPALNHYQCYCNYMLVLQGTRVSNTVKFFPPSEQDTLLSTTDNVSILIGQLIDVISAPKSSQVGLTLDNDVVFAL